MTPDDFARLAREAKPRITEVTAQLAAELVAAGALLLDVREQGEFDQIHLQGTLHASLGTLDSRAGEVAPDKSRPLVCYCAGGIRSAVAADKLQQMGYLEVYSVEGGIKACALTAGFTLSS